MAGPTKAELIKQRDEALAKLATVDDSVKAWYSANPLALILVALVSFGAGALIF